MDKSPVKAVFEASDLQKEAAKSNYQAQIRNLKLAQRRDIQRTAHAKSIFDAISAAQQEMMQLQAHQMQQDLASNILTSGVMMSADSLNLIEGQNLMSEKQMRLAQLKHLSNEPERQTDDAMITNNISVLEGQINAIEGQKDLDANFEDSRKNYFGDLRSRLGRAAIGGKIKRGVGLGVGLGSTATNYFLNK